MNFSKFTVSGLIGLFLTFTSCIDADYDLGKDIDMEVTIGGNLSLPIGKTDTIRLSRMIEEGDVLHVIDGKYVITKSDNISEDIDAIDEVVIDNFSPHFEPYIRTFKASSIEELPQIPGLDMPDIEIAFDANINTTEHFNVNTELPTEVKEVKTVKITDNYGKTLQTELSIEISGMPRFLPRLYLAGVELSLPDVIDFDIDESHGDLVRNGSSIFISKTIELNQGSGSVSIPVTVYGFSDPIVENGSLILTDEISLKGKVYADKQAIGSEDLQNTTVTVQPRLDLATPQIRIKEVAGTIVPNVDINTSVSLADLPDFLKEEGTSLEVKDLALNLSVQNPITCRSNPMTRTATPLQDWNSPSISKFRPLPTARATNSPFNRPKSNWSSKKTVKMPCKSWINWPYKLAGAIRTTMMSRYDPINLSWFTSRPDSPKVLKWI